MSVSVPDAREQEIMQRNGMNPKEFGVVLSEKDRLVLINHATRDNVTIYQGDKKW